MAFENAEKLAKGLRDRGVVLSGLWFYINRDHGQGMMNSSAMEAAPTWYLKRDAMRRGNKITSVGYNPDVEWEGRSAADVEVCSHMPLMWVLKHPVELWEIGWEEGMSQFVRRLVVNAPDLPPEWK